jgi:hypothetical protein
MDVVVGNCLKAFAGMLAMLADLSTDLLGRAVCQVRLFSSNTQIQPNTDLASLTEANFSGYSPGTVTSFLAPAIDQTGNAYMASNLIDFTNNGGGVGNNIYSAALCATEAGGVAATGTAHETAGAIDTVTLSTGGSGYKVAPKVTVAGAPGVGAVVTATVVGGVVTALTIVNPGSGYVAPTLTIEAPVAMVAFVNFLNPRPMNLVTDALPLIMQINQVS